MASCEAAYTTKTFGSTNLPVCWVILTGSGIMAIVVFAWPKASVPIRQEHTSKHNFFM
jgi:hypothetical protein